MYANYGSDHFMLLSMAVIILCAYVFVRLSNRCFQFITK